MQNIYFLPALCKAPSSASSCNPFGVFVTGAMIIYCLFTEHSCPAAGQPHTSARRREIFILGDPASSGHPKIRFQCRWLVLTTPGQVIFLQFFSQFAFFLWSRWSLRTIPSTSHPPELFTHGEKHGLTPSCREEDGQLEIKL